MTDTSSPDAKAAKSARGRRADYAALTRQAIIDSARSLFAAKGFFATTVEDIATSARVAPATVYAVGGGKHGLLHTLLDQWQSAPVIEATYQHIGTLADGETILRATAAGTREVREQWGDVMRMMLVTAPHDPRVAESLAAVTGNYRQGIALTAQRLADVRALKPDVSVATATDILWFYFGYSSYFTLTDENGWPLAKAEQWLLAQASSALLP
ncbi:MAG TPA: TetR family transcriptional regulator [Trebonia sp.]|nr:TetR family transcriptional regulator [Trebonia sp.]